MKTDDRDERLGRALAGAVADLGYRSVDATRLMRRGSRRRAGAAIASVTVAGVFVAAIGVAATRFGQDAPPPSGPRPSVATDVREGWTKEVAGPGGFAAEVTYPERWKLESFESLSTDSYAQPVFRLGTSKEVVRGVACGILEVFPGQATILILRDPLGPYEAVMSVQAYTGAGWGKPPRVPAFAPRPTTFDWTDAQRSRRHDCGRPAYTSTFFVRDGGRWIFHVSMGSAVKDGRIGNELLDVMNGIALPPDPTSPIRFIPSTDWVSDTTNAATDVSAWTANAPMSAEEATFPDPAALPEDGILVTVFQVGDESPEPDNPNFEPASLPLDLSEEIETSWEGYTEGTSRSTLVVAVNGRALNVHVYYGTTDPSEEMLVEAEAALERLIVEPMPVVQDPVALPPPVRDEYRWEFVSKEKGSRIQPISAPVEPGVVYRFEVAHCGLDWMVDFDGSFWEPVYVMPGRKPDSSFNADVGTIVLVGPNEARFVSSSDEQVSLFRLAGPIYPHPCL